MKLQMMIVVVCVGNEMMMLEFTTNSADEEKKHCMLRYVCLEREQQETGMRRDKAERRSVFVLEMMMNELRKRNEETKKLFLDIVHNQLIACSDRDKTQTNNLRKE